MKFYISTKERKFIRKITKEVLYTIKTPQLKKPLILAQSISKYILKIKIPSFAFDEYTTAGLPKILKGVSSENTLVETDIIYIIFREIAKELKKRKSCQNSKLKSKQ